MVKSLSMVTDIKNQRARQKITRHSIIKCGVLIAPLLMVNTYADGNPTFAFDLPEQPLSVTLDNVAQSTQTKLLYADVAVKGLSAAPVRGKYTAQQALDIALDKSGLSYKVVDQSLITVAGKSVKESETILKAMTVMGDGIRDPNDPYNPDYNRTNASTATKTDTPIMETPYAVTVVPQQVLKDQQVIRVEDAVKNVAGVLPGSTNGGASDTFQMRGFQNTTVYRDGFILPDALGGGTSKQQTANLERIEVLKGPGSILYGRNQPGGVINLVTKRPQATPYHSIQQQFGSYDFYRTTADSTGAITPDDKLLYRVNLSYENANSFRDFFKTDAVFLAPSLTWNISNKTQANLDIQYEHFNNSMDSGVPPLGNRPAPIPISRQVGEPLNNKNVGDRTYIGANWSHAFNDNWKLSHRFGAEFFDATTLYTCCFSFATPDGNLSRAFNNGNTHTQTYYTTLNLTGKFNTAMLEHTLLSGFDYFVFDNQGEGAFTNAPTINIFNPTYLATAPALNYTPNPSFNQEWYGLYLQDQIKFPFNVYGNVGLRYDNTTGNKSTVGTTTEDDHISPRGGLLWRPLQWLSMYGSYSENFGPNWSLYNGPGQQALPSQTAQQWELGAKTEFFNGRLSASFAYFDLTKQNLPVPDPQNLQLQRTIGEQESRGYEFEASGEVLPGWRVIGAYTYMPYAYINKDVDQNGGPGDTGHRMFNAPRNFGSLWNTYEFQNAELRGLKLGGGVIAVSQSQGSSVNDFQLPGYVTVNLSASYGMEVAGSKVTLQLNANNLLDKTYYTGTNTWTTIGVGTPRFFMGSVKVEF